MRGIAQLALRAAAIATFVAPAAACEARSTSAIERPAAPLALTGRVVDAANILSPPVEAALDKRLAAIEHDTRAQFVVVSTPSLNGLSIAEYGLRLGRGWGIGDAKRNDGLLLIVAPNDRKVRIEVGYGLEATLTNRTCQTIINDDILPRYRTGDLTGGTLAGVDALEARLRGAARSST